MRSHSRVVAVSFALVVVALVAAAPRAQAPASAIRDVAMGDTFAFVVRADGSVFGWGREDQGFAARPPVLRGSVPEPARLELPKPVRQIAVNRTSAYAVAEDGTLLAWGGNDEWQLGNSPSGPVPPRGGVGAPSPQPIVVGGLRDVTQVAAAGKYAMALQADGRVFAWGGLRMAALDVSPGAPVEVGGLQDIVQIAASPRHQLALGRDGRVWSWGHRNNEWGELGRDAGDEPWQPAPVAGLDRVVSIAAGGGDIPASGAVRDDGTVWVWGGNQSAMMGNGKNPVLGEPGSVNPSPMVVTGVTGARSIVMGSGHVAVLLGDGTLRMWGHDGWGQIGFGTSGFYQERPRQPKIAGVAAVYLGGNRSAAVKTDGTLWIWGPSYPQTRGVLAQNQHVPVALSLPQ